MRPVRAVICDVYRTLLDVGEVPADAEERWSTLYRSMFDKNSALSLDQLASRCRDIISEDHQGAHGRGILYPEVNWPSVMNRALPALDTLKPADADAFLFKHAQLSRSVRMMQDCPDVLRECIRRGILLGIASNAQAYTLGELELALGEVGLELSIFQSDLTFWSFEHGFSKPDPHVFEILRARLRNRCLSTSEAIMVGDREDKDIAPARAAGWRTWHILKNPNGLDQGSWPTLARALFVSGNPSP